MSITFGCSSSEPKQRTNIGLDNVKIAKAEVVYNKAQKWQKKPDDVGIEMELDIGKDWNPTFYVGGWFKSDPISGNCEGWSTAFKVKILLEAVGLTGAKLDYSQPVEHQRFPEDLASSLVGKKFTRLSYKTTKKKESGDHYWRDWQQVAPENHFEELRKEFMEAVTHRNPDTDEPQPYVKDFLDPEQDVDDALEGPWDDEITATETPIDGAVPKAPVMPNL